MASRAAEVVLASAGVSVVYIFPFGCLIPVTLVSLHDMKPTMASPPPDGQETTYGCFVK